jgi:hypothetical protein
MPFDGVEFVRDVAGQNRSSKPPVPLAKQRWYERVYSYLAPGDRTVAVPDDAPADPGLAALHLLEDARQMIEPPERWTQGLYRTLRAYCAVGALRAVARRRNDRAGLTIAHDLLKEVAVRRGFSTVEGMNDRSTHQAVLSAFDEAIAAARHAYR